MIEEAEDTFNIWKNSNMYLVAKDFVRIIREGLENDNEFLQAYMEGYVLGSKDVLSQGIYLNDGEIEAEKVAAVSLYDIVDPIFSGLTPYDDYCPAGDFIRSLIDVIKNTPHLQPTLDFKMLTVKRLIHYIKTKDQNFSSGFLNGYIDAIKDFLILYVAEDENEVFQISNTELENILDRIQLNYSPNQYENYCAEAYVVTAIKKESKENKRDYSLSHFIKSNQDSSIISKRGSNNAVKPKKNSLFSWIVVGFIIFVLICSINK